MEFNAAQLTAIAAVLMGLIALGYSIAGALGLKRLKKEAQATMNEAPPISNHALTIVGGRRPIIQYTSNPDLGPSMLAYHQPQAYPLLIEIRGPRLEIWRPAPSLEGQGPKKTLLLATENGKFTAVSPHIQFTQVEAGEPQQSEEPHAQE